MPGVMLCCVGEWESLLGARHQQQRGAESGCALERRGGSQECGGRSASAGRVAARSAERRSPHLLTSSERSLHKHFQYQLQRPTPAVRGREW